MKTLQASILFAILCVACSNYSFAQENENTSSDTKKEQLINQTDSARVYVSFYIEKDGSVSNVKVQKIECNKCSKTFKNSLKSESIRVIKNMPKWNIPDERRKFVLPIKFKLED